MAFPLGSFAGGVSQGLEQGQQMRARQMALQDEMRQRAAQEAASNWLQSLAQQPDGQQGPAPTAVPPQPTPAVPQGPQAGVPQQVPMPGAQPMPGPQQAPQPAMATPMPGAPPAGPQPAPPRPMPGAPQGGPPGPAGMPSGPPVSGTAGGASGDPFSDAKKTLQSVARGIAQANPGRKWKPGELLDAVNTAVKTMDGLNPMEKIAAQAQIAGSKAQLEYWQRETQAQDEQRKERADEQRKTRDEQASTDRNAKIAADLKRAQMTTDSREKVARLQAATRLQASEIAQSGQNDRLGKTLDFRQQALDAGLDEKEWQAALTAELKAQGLSDAFATKLFSAQSASGQTPAAPARPKVGGAVPPPPARGGQRRPAPAGAGGKPIPAETMSQWAQIPPQNKAAAKQHLAEQGYDVSGLR